MHKLRITCDGMQELRKSIIGKNATLCPRKSKHFVSMCEREKPACPSMWKPMYRTLVHKGRSSMHPKRALSIPCEL